MIDVTFVFLCATERNGHQCKSKYRTLKMTVYLLRQDYVYAKQAKIVYGEP